MNNRMDLLILLDHMSSCLFLVWFVLLGVMGGAGVGWSTCSKNDMDTMLQ
jgi:preprotein translocase subunit SecG